MLHTDLQERPRLHADSVDAAGFRGIRAQAKDANLSMNESQNDLRLFVCTLSLICLVVY